MTITIEEYQKDRDWAAVCQVHDSARLQELAASVGIGAFRPLAEVAESEGLFDGSVYVAREQGRLLGFVAFTAQELTWLYVDPTSQGMGIGGRLLELSISKMTRPATTEVLAGNKRALDLYLRAGFREVEIRTGHLSGDPNVPATGHILTLD